MLVSRLPISDELLQWSCNDIDSIFMMSSRVVADVHTCYKCSERDVRKRSRHVSEYFGESIPCTQLWRAAPGGEVEPKPENRLNSGKPFGSDQFCGGQSHTSKSYIARYRNIS